VGRIRRMNKFGKMKKRRWERRSTEEREKRR
jgi:hypothetical protein